MSFPNLLLQGHVMAGALALGLGATALASRKGGKVHRRSGRLFVYAMLAMGITAGPLGNIGGGLMAIYFVVTGITTVRPDTTVTRWINRAALAVVVLVAFVLFAKGLEAFASPGRALNGVPFVMLFFMGIMMALAAGGDVRAMVSGPPRGRARISRHVWRMCFALLIAAGSFFSIEARVARVLPWPFTTGVMRLAPMVGISVAMIYWLWRVRGGAVALNTARGERRDAVS